MRLFQEETITKKEGFSFFFFEMHLGKSFHLSTFRWCSFECERNALCSYVVSFGGDLVEGN